MNKEKFEQMLIQTNAKIKEIEEQIQSFPEGKILCLNNGKYIQWYQVENGIKKYIPKKNIELARSLCYKQYLLSELQDLYTDRKALLGSLKCYKNYESKEKKYFENEKYREILKHIKSTENEEIMAWRKEPYSRNTYNPGGLKFQSISGNILRSKSEVIIDQLLFMNAIPYRYECELKLGDSVIYPDFTIRHPKTGEYIFWEHFGMMDSPSYSQKAFSKMQNYCANGYIPFINLITTFETSQCPIDAVKVKNIIFQYFKE